MKEDNQILLIQQIDQKRCKRRIQLNCLQVLFLGMIFTTVLLIRGIVGEAQIQENISRQIIRFHVLANSDSDQDQQLKLKVKTEIVLYMQKQLEKAQNIHEAREQIKLEMSNMQRIARRVVIEEGYEYDVSIQLTNCYFPAKTYGDLIFPPGEYEAVRVLIGKAEGKNWWCVIFPSLCMVDETYSVVPEESKEKLQKTLSEEEYDSIKTEDSTVDESEVEVRFWLYDFVTNLW